MYSAINCSFRAFPDISINSEINTTKLNNYILKRFGQYPKGFYTAKFTENISIESLLIHDKNDKIIPFSDLAAIESGLKNSKSYVTTGLGHKLKHEKIWTTCLDFLKF